MKGILLAITGSMTCEKDCIGIKECVYSISGEYCRLYSFVDMDATLFRTGVGKKNYIPLFDNYTVSYGIYQAISSDSLYNRTICIENCTKDPLCTGFSSDTLYCEYIKQTQGSTTIMSGYYYVKNITIDEDLQKKPPLNDTTTNSNENGVALSKSAIGAIVICCIIGTILLLWVLMRIVCRH